MKAGGRFSGGALAILTDQVVASASNFLLPALVAHSASSTEFGRFALAYTMFWLVLGGLRALVAEPLLVVAQRGDTQQRLDAVRQASQVAFVAVLLICLLLGGAALVLHSPEFVALAVVMPGVVLQDQLRYAYFLYGMPKRVLIMDSAWLAIMGFGVLLRLLGWNPSPSAWLLFWGVAGGLCYVAGTVHTRWWPARRGGGAWLSRHGSLCYRVLGEFAVSTGVQQTVLFALPVVAGLSALGSLKAAQLAVGPLSVFLTAGTVIALPVFSRLNLAGDYDSLRRRSIQLAAVNVAVGAAAAVVLWLLPTSVGTLILGSSWKLGHVLAPLIALQVAAIGVNTGAMLALRAMEHAQQSLRIRLALVPVTLALALAGASAFGGLGAALGLLLGSTIAVVVWWRGLLATLKTTKEAANSALSPVARAEVPAP